MDRVREITKMLTVKEAVRAFPGLSEYCIRRLIAGGNLPYVTAGRKILISEQVLNDYVSGRLSADSTKKEKNFVALKS